MENKKVERITSRIGDIPVKLPSGVNVSVANNTMTVKGSKGELCQSIPEGIELDIQGDTVNIVNAIKNKKVKAFHGMTRALLANMVNGVKDGFTKRLVIEGVGYRAAIKGKSVEVSVGYSQPVLYDIPDDVSISVDQNVKIEVTGIDKSRVGQVAADIRKIRPPEPYKGKGIRYEDERVRKKVGKSGA